jgi:tRNA-2-methylthio-N6-dimethylallyladenosine synthase
MISGFPTETEQDHQDTLTVMDYVKYDYGYMFSYSERPGTMAARKMEDDIPEEIKQRRLSEIIAVQRDHCKIRVAQYLGMVQEILIEGTSKKDATMWKGRNSQNVVAVFPKENYQLGDFVNVKMNACTSATLIGEAIGLSDNN